MSQCSDRRTHAHVFPCNTVLHN